MLENKIMIIGSNGMLGTYLKKQFPKAISLTRKELDIENKKNILDIFKKYSPEIVINAIAYTNVDSCEENKELCFNINYNSVGELSKICKEFKSILIHYSTNYVFDGKKKSGYLEKDKPNPISVYGESKSLSEEIIKKTLNNFYIIRTSVIFGDLKKDFVGKVLTLSENNSELKFVNDQYFSPIYAKDLALETKNLICNKIPFGIYHITNKGSCSWYELGKKILELKNKKLVLNEISFKEFHRKAQVPQYGILINSFKEINLRTWERALEEYLNNH